MLLFVEEKKFNVFDLGSKHGTFVGHENRLPVHVTMGYETKLSNNEGALSSSASVKPIIANEIEKYRMIKNDLLALSSEAKGLHSAHEIILCVGGTVQLGQVTLTLREHEYGDELDRVRKPNTKALDLSASGKAPFLAWVPGAHDKRLVVNQLRADFQTVPLHPCSSLDKTHVAYERFHLYILFIIFHGILVFALIHSMCCMLYY
jgi:hypothetical protein